MRGAVVARRVGQDELLWQLVSGVPFFFYTCPTCTQKALQIVVVANKLDKKKRCLQH